jgi:hypothetical protein
MVSIAKGSANGCYETKEQGKEQRR